MKIRVHLICINTEHGIEKAVLPHLIKTVWHTRFEKQTQKIYLQVTLFIPAHHSAIMIEFTPKVEFGKLMTELFKKYVSGYEKTFFRDWLAFRDQRDGFHIDKACWTYVNDPVTFWDCATNISPGLAKLASKLMEVPGNSVPGK